MKIRNSITVSIAAKIMGVSRQAMHKIIEREGLKTQKFSFAPHMILLDRDEILKLADKRRRNKK